MTRTQFTTLVAEQVRLNASDPAEQNRILLWGDLVNRRLARDWYWEDLSHDVKITVVEGQRVYPFSGITTDIDAKVIEVGQMDPNSFRVGNTDLVYRPKEWLDGEDPDWLAATNTGSSIVFTIHRRRIVLSKVPDAAYAGTIIYARASVIPAAPSSAGAAINLEDLTPGWPENLQELLVSGTCVWGYERQGADDYLQKRQEWLDTCAEFNSNDVMISDYEAQQDLPSSFQGFGTGR